MFHFINCSSFIIQFFLIMFCRNPISFLLHFLGKFGLSVSSIPWEWETGSNGCVDVLEELQPWSPRHISWLDVLHLYHLSSLTNNAYTDIDYIQYLQIYIIHSKSTKINRFIYELVVAQWVAMLPHNKKVASLSASQARRSFCME